MKTGLLFLSAGIWFGMYNALIEEKVKLKKYIENLDKNSDAYIKAKNRIDLIENMKNENDILNAFDSQEEFIPTENNKEFVICI